MSLFCRCFFTNFTKNKLSGLFKWKIGWKWVNICFETPFTKNVVGLETSQLICIANHLSSFCLIRVLTKNCFWTKSSKFVNVLKSVSGIDLFRYECKLVILFSPFEVSRLEQHIRNTPFSFAVVQKFILNDSSVLNVFVLFSGYIEDLSTKKYV